MAVDAYPPPIVEWYVNGILVTQSRHYEMFHENGKEVLLIVDVQPEDTGEYTCKVITDTETYVSTTTLYVTGGCTCQGSSFFILLSLFLHII